MSVHGLTRDDEHVYRIGSKVVPGVTKIMDQTLRDFSGVPRHLLESKRELGQLVHEATALDAIGELDEASIDREVVPYVVAWRKFMVEVKPKIFSSEEFVYHPTYGYAGQLDHRMLIQGYEGIVDKKTGVEDRADAVQLSAYLAAKYHNDDVTRFMSCKRWILSLRPDGNYRLREYPDYFHVFLAALTCYRFKTEGWK